MCFLYGRDKGPEVAAKLAHEMRDFRGLPARPARSRTPQRSRAARHRTALRQVMARTERVASTVERDFMMGEPPIAVSVAPADLAQAAAVSNVARALDAPEIIEYWKSAPYLLNFMRDYSLKRLLEDAAGRTFPRAPRCAPGRARRRCSIARRLTPTRRSTRPTAGCVRSWTTYSAQDLDQNLWIPAAMPYYGTQRSERAADQGADLLLLVDGAGRDRGTLSYEAERRMGVGEAGRRYFEQHRLRPLQFRQDQGRLGGSARSAAGLSITEVGRIGDPLAVFAETETTSVAGGDARSRRRTPQAALSMLWRTGDIQRYRASPNGPPRR